MNRELRRLLLENDMSSGKKTIPSNPKTLIRSLPDDLKLLLFQQWNAKQNPTYHPEGNTFKHILIVLKRAYSKFPDDPNMILSALFHDLGKMDTYEINPKTGLPTAHGHEKKSAEYVDEFKDWVDSIEGADSNVIKYIVTNHMRVKPETWSDMRNKKKRPVADDPNFQKLKDFTTKLDGGGYDLDRNVDDAYLEVKPANLKKSKDLDEDLMSNIKKGVAGAALATSMMGSPAIGSETPTKSKDEPKELRTYGVSKSTNEIIARVKTVLGINKPIGELTKEELKSAYARINMPELKNDIESNFSSSDISNLQAELDWVLGGDQQLDYNGTIDKQTVIAIFKYIGRLRVKKPVAGKIPDVEPKSYPFGYIK
jgi:hypothetical protein